MKNFFCFWIFVFLFFSCQLTDLKQPETNSPTWARDLIIYEVAIKGFTSPGGPESGNFASLKEKMKYLADVGINGIWLSGHNFASDHFYGIWTQYAAIRQDSLDPSLGTAADFKAMIDEAHRYDIKVFLDVITHGVVNGSPIITEHPQWFKNGSWGMTDFDWFGNHPDLDKWWVDTWLNYVLEYGVDGFRIDCDIYRPDLWAKIKQEAKNKGKEMIIFEEGAVLFPGVTDSRQILINCASHRGLVKDYPTVTNAAGHLNRLMSYGSNTYQLIIHYKNKTTDTLSPNEYLSVNYNKRFFKAEGAIPYEDHSTEIKLLMHEKKDSINGIKVTRFENGVKYWDTHWWIPFEGKDEHPNWPNSWKNKDTLIVLIPESDPHSILLFNQVSCHDNGWEGYPEDKNPFSVQGSRCVMGYSGILTPTVPIIFSGEEFNASYHALPRLMPSLFGKVGKPGKGRWLYGAMIDWNDTLQKQNKDFLDDVKRMINIRKSERELFNGYALQSGCKILPVKYVCTDSIPQPFIIYNNEKAVMVAGNNQLKKITCTIHIPANIFSGNNFKVTDLFHDEKKIISDKEINITIDADNTKGGGLAVLKIEPKK